MEDNRINIIKKYIDSSFLKPYLKDDVTDITYNGQDLFVEDRTRGKRKINEEISIEIIKEFSSYVKGSYALGIIFDDELDVLYATRQDSPLIIGIGEEENLIQHTLLLYLFLFGTHTLLFEVVFLVPYNFRLFHCEQS